MGQDYTPSGTYPTMPLNLVKDGEVYNFDSIMQSSDAKKGLFAKLIDGMDYVKTRLEGVVGAANNTLITRDIDPTAYIYLVAASWTIQSTGNPNAAVNTAASMLITIPPSALPHGATLVDFNVSILPAAHANLPATMPQVSLASFDVGTGAAAIGSTAVDNSNIGVYDAQHTLQVVAPANTVVDRTTKRYYATFTNEAGANAQTSLLIVASWVRYRLG